MMPAEETAREQALVRILRELIIEQWDGWYLLSPLDRNGNKWEAQCAYCLVRQPAGTTAADFAHDSDCPIARAWALLHDQP